MKHLTTFAGSLLPIVLAITGCKKSAAPDETAARPAEAAKPAAPAGPAAVVGVWKDLPNINGFAADVPAGAEPNGLGGAAGFHTTDDSFDLTWMETSAEEAAKDFATTKQAIEEVLFTKWIKAEPTADGWVLTWEAITIDENANPTGKHYAFQVRRKLGDQTYTCYGAVAKPEQLTAPERSCLTLRAL